jgi:6-phosphogluconolactonase (cycloisomerase 2 family)
MKIASGMLTTISSLTLPASPMAIAVAPNGNFLYVSTIDGIYLYTINSNGSLTLGNSGGRITSDQAGTMQVDSTNSWLVEVISGSTQLNAVNINSSTGVLKSTTEETIPLPASADVKQLAISPNDSSSCTTCYVFVAMGAGGIETVGFNPGNANPFANAVNYSRLYSGGDTAVAVDPTNRGNKSVSGSSTDNIASFSVTTTALSPINTATAGPAGVIALAVDSTGGYLMAVDFAGSPDLQIYTMSAGTLTSAFTSTTGTDPVGAVAIAAAP